MSLLVDTQTLEQEQAAVDAAKAEEQAKAEADIPEKYRGKSVQEIIEMHQNAEQELGRKGNEVGQLRSLTDQLLGLNEKRQSDLAKGGAQNIEENTPALPAVTSDELFDDPSAAIGKVVSATIESQEQKRKQEAEAEAAAEAETEFNRKHPDAVTIVQNQDFVNWINESPTRKITAARASTGDLYAGAALLDEWKDLQKAEEPAEESPEIQAAQAASTVAVNQQSEPRYGPRR